MNVIVIIVKLLHIKICNNCKLFGNMCEEDIKTAKCNVGPEKITSRKRQKPLINITGGLDD